MSYNSAGDEVSYTAEDLQGLRKGLEHPNIGPHHPSGIVFRARSTDVVDEARGPVVPPDLILERTRAVNEQNELMGTFICGGCGITVTEGHKCDKGKPEWDLFPFDAAEGVVRVLMYGKKKYTAHQWRTGGGIGSVRAVAAALRHTFAWLRGEDLDAESGLHHLDHAICELLFAVDSVRRGNKGDTRWRG